MGIVIENKNEAPLLDKIKIVASIYTQDKIPSKEELCKDLAKQLSVKEELITIEHVYNTFGLAKAKIFASCYTKPATKEFFKKMVKKVAAPVGGA